MISREQVLKAMIDLGCDPSEVEQISKHLPDDSVSLVIYGSRARGDYRDHSDFDLLRIAEKQFKNLESGKTHVVTYTKTQLENATHTLFGMHLKRDGRQVAGHESAFSDIMSRIESPDPELLIAKVKHYSQILNFDFTSDEVLLDKGVRLARYLLRTAVYAKSLRSGAVCFSVRDLAEKFQDPSLATILSSEREITGEPSESLLEELLNRLEVEIGAIHVTAHETLEELILATAETDKNLHTMALRASKLNPNNFNYSELPKILL